MTNNRNQSSAICKFLGVLLIMLPLGLLIVPLDSIESLADSATLALSQVLADLDLSSTISEELLIPSQLSWPQDGSSPTTQLNSFVAERVLVLEYLQQIGLALIIRCLLVLSLALPAFITGALFAQLQCQIDAARFGLGSLSWRYFMKSCLLGGFLFLTGLLISGPLLQEFLPLDPMQCFNLLVLCAGIWAFFFGSFLVHTRWHRQR